MAMIVKADQATYNNILNNRSYAVYIDNSVDTINKNFVCINPNAGLFGGFGNLVFSLLAAQIVALLTNRVPVMNHQLMLNMFVHPDPRQSWDLIPAKKFKSLKESVKTRGTRCSDVITIPLAEIPFKYGTNGCLGAYFSHPDSVKILAELFPLTYPVEQVPEYDQWVAPFAQWVFSRPKESWTQVMNVYKNRTFAPCGNNTEKADLAVQFRTWRDLHKDGGVYHEVGGLCFQHCAREMALHTLRRLNRPICVFITSDNDTSSAYLANSLNELSPLNIRAVYGVEANPADWHSNEIVEKGRWCCILYTQSSLYNCNQPYNRIYLILFNL